MPYSDPVKLKEYSKIYYLKNKERHYKKCREWTVKNSESVREYKKLWYLNNKSKRQERDKNNRKEINEKHRIYIKNNINAKLARRLRGRIWDALKNNKKGGSPVKDLGCSINELKFYLEGKFKDGMTWENHGVNGWHIDHIIPLAFFDLTDRTQFLKACHYSNLQPLWAKDNISKQDKILI